MGGVSSVTTVDLETYLAHCRDVSVAASEGALLEPWYPRYP